VKTASTSRWLSASTTKCPKGLVSQKRCRLGYNQHPSCWLTPCMSLLRFAAAAPDSATESGAASCDGNLPEYVRVLSVMLDAGPQGFVGRVRNRWERSATNSGLTQLQGFRSDFEHMSRYKLLNDNDIIRFSHRGHHSKASVLRIEEILYGSWVGDISTSLTVYIFSSITQLRVNACRHHSRSVFQINGEPALPSPG
jgi:hypothetical protein